MNRNNDSVPALVTKVVWPDGAIDSMAWNNRANLIESRVITSHLTYGLPTRTTQWEYTSDSTADSPSRIIGPDGLSTYFSYNSLGLPATATAPGGHVTSYRYQRTGRLAGVVDSVIEHSVLHFDSAAAYSESTTDVAWRFGYNRFGNLVSDTTPLGRSRQLGRDAMQRVDTVVDGGGHRTRFGYDLLNRITDVFVHVEDTPADSGFMGALRTRYQYADDMLATILDPRDVPRGYEYDKADRRRPASRRKSNRVILAVNLLS